tara:strand:+ start:3543 stop:6710 length:3168 start_codon:yes stop_codon:yes gene_type:complete
MARVQSVQTSFADGQISPRMQGYVDLPSYRSSLKVCQNYIPLPQGSVARRPGTFYVSRSKDNGAVRLVPFNFGSGQSYILEFGASYIRFYREDAIVTTDATTISSVNNSTNVITLADASTLSVGDDIYFSTTGALPNGLLTDQRYFIKTKSSNDITLSLADNTIGAAFDLSTASGSGTHTVKAPLEKSTSYTAGQIDDLYFTQSADVLFIAHPEHKVAELKRVSDTNWTITDLDLKDGPYLPLNTEDTTLTVATSISSNADRGLIATLEDANIDHSNNKFKVPNHGLVDNSLVYFDGSDLPNGVSASTDYHIISATLDEFQISTSAGGSAVTFSDAGTGTRKIYYKQYGYQLVGEMSKDGPDTTGTNAFTMVNHPLVNGQRVFYIGGTGLSGLSANTEYYVIGATTNTFKVADSVGGSENPLSGTVSAELKWYKKFIPKNTKITIEASSTTGINDGDGFKSTDVGRIIRLNTEVAPQIKWGYAEISTHTDSKNVAATLQEEIAYVDATTEWQLGSFSSTTGHPRTCQIYQQRMVLAGTTEEPQTVHFSKTGDFDNFSASESLGVRTGNFDTAGASIMGEQIYSDNAFSLMISSDTVDKIEWINEGRRLSLGTSGGIYQMFGNRDDVTITPFNFTIEKISNWSAHDSALPAQVGNNVLYIQKNGRKVRELIFDREQEQYSAKDISLRAEDITQTGVKNLVFQDQPASLLWVLRTDGKVATCTYNVDLNMNSWSMHSIGGTHTDSTYGNHAKVDSIAGIPRGSGASGHDQLWMVVKRDVDEYLTQFPHTDINASTNVITIASHGLSDGDAVKFSTADTMPANLTAGTTYYVRDKTTNTFKVAAASGGTALDIDQGSGTHTIYKKDVTQRFVEYLEQFYDNSMAADTAHFVDCGANYSGSSASTLTGLHYIEGGTLSVLGDSANQPDKTVLAGELSLALAVTKARVGFSYNSDLQTLALAIGDPSTQTSIGNKKRIHRIHVKLLDTMGLKYGVSSDDLTIETFRLTSDSLSTALPLFTGDRELAMPGVYDSLGEIYLRQDQPFPSSILHVAIDYETNE